MKNRCLSLSGGQSGLYSGDIIFSVLRFLVSVYINIKLQLSSHSISSGNEECSACETGCLYQTAAAMKVRLGYLSNHEEYRGVWLQGGHLNTYTYWNIHQYDEQGSSYANSSHVNASFFSPGPPGECTIMSETLDVYFRLICIHMYWRLVCSRYDCLNYLSLPVAHVKFAFHDI